MSFSIGIVGLPNVGKSTLFNALTKSDAKASNYPFCTIDPNRAIVNVEDERLEKLAEIHKSVKLLPTTIEFVDIAGLVAGASEGEGLGNQFLSHIRETNAIAHVIRLFRDPAIIREDALSPLKDLNVIFTELFLSDYKLVEKRIEATEKLVKRLNDRSSKEQLATLNRIKDLVLDEKLLFFQDWSEDEEKFIKTLNLLTFKPILLIVNIDENDLTEYQENDLFKEIKEFADKNKIEVVPLCARIEHELSLLDEASLEEYREVLGVEKSGLQDLIRQCYKTLDLITFITSGETETRAWTVKRGTLAPQAAGVIHSDFEQGFIKLEAMDSVALIELGSQEECKKKGKFRIEGKAYEVQDGDVCHFLFNR